MSTGAIYMAMRAARREAVNPRPLTPAQIARARRLFVMGIALAWLAVAVRAAEASWWRLHIG